MKHLAPGDLAPAENVENLAGVEYDPAYCYYTSGNGAILFRILPDPDAVNPYHEYDVRTMRVRDSDFDTAEQLASHLREEGFAAMVSPGWRNEVAYTEKDDMDMLQIACDLYKYWAEGEIWAVERYDAWLYHPDTLAPLAYKQTDCCGGFAYEYGFSLEQAAQMCKTLI